MQKIVHSDNLIDFLFVVTLVTIFFFSHANIWSNYDIYVQPMLIVTMIGLIFGYSYYISKKIDHEVLKCCNEESLQRIK